MKKKNPDMSELQQIAREKRKVQFYLRLMLGLGSSCGVMVPIEPFFTTLNELSAHEAALLQQQAKDQSDQSE
ncbi:hypothetical protein NSS64_01335 [Paenibacillus sp. FSL H8-0122]|uniref:hypothetical protein n=1 Tax=Paenibacillus sp. FSL H8-0122 TaxID=2954510 RepID=UPI0030F6F928